MAKPATAEADDDLFDDADIEGDGEADADPTVPEGDAATGEDAGTATATDDDAKLIAEASKAASDIGLVVPDDTDDCEEWVRHFITAVKTHSSTKDMAKAEQEAEDAKGTEEGETAAPEPNMVSMSTSQKNSVRLSRLVAENAEHRQAAQFGRIDYIREHTPWGLSEKEANDLKARIGAKKLSLVDGDDAEVNALALRIDAQYQMACSYARKNGLLGGSKVDLSLNATAAPVPGNPWPENAEDAKAQGEVLTEMKRLANLN